MLLEPLVIEPFSDYQTLINHFVPHQYNRHLMNLLEFFSWLRDCRFSNFIQFLSSQAVFTIIFYRLLFQLTAILLSPESAVLKIRSAISSSEPFEPVTRSYVFINLTNIITCKVKCPHFNRNRHTWW